MTSRMLRQLLVVVTLVVMTSACEQMARSTVSPSPVVVPTTGTVTASPGSTSLGHSVNVSWTATSSVRVDVCNVQCSTLATATVSGQTTHTPSAPGEWQYVLYGVAAQPDVFVRLAETSVTVR